MDHSQRELKLNNVSNNLRGLHAIETFLLAMLTSHLYCILFLFSESCLDLQKELYRSDDRRIAETHYQIGKQNLFTHYQSLALKLSLMITLNIVLFLQVSQTPWHQTSMMQSHISRMQRTFWKLESKLWRTPPPLLKMLQSRSSRLQTHSIPSREKLRS